MTLVRRPEMSSRRPNEYSSISTALRSSDGGFDIGPQSGGHALVAYSIASGPVSVVLSVKTGTSQSVLFTVKSSSYDMCPGQLTRLSRQVSDDEDNEDNRKSVVATCCFDVEVLSRYAHAHRLERKRSKFVDLLHCYYRLELLRRRHESFSGFDRLDLTLVGHRRLASRIAARHVLAPSCYTRTRVQLSSRSLFVALHFHRFRRP